MRGCAEAEVEATHPDLLPLHRRPVDSLEPRVTLDVLRTALEVSEPQTEVRREKPLDEILCERVDVSRDSEPALEDFLVDLERIVGEEGRVAGEELEEEDAECPPVGGGVVAGSGDDLGREVFGCERTGQLRTREAGRPRLMEAKETHECRIA